MVPRGSSGDPGRQKIAQFRPRPLSSLAIVREPHSKEPRAIAELGIVESVARARIDDELDHGAGLSPRQPLAIRRGRHVVHRADQNEGRDFQSQVRYVVARRIERRRGFERRIDTLPEAAGGRDEAILSAVSAPCEKPIAAILAGST